MFVLKNALKCISRAKARNILIGIIVLVIATSACIGLSIRQAAISAKKDAMENLSITATISFDRQSVMGQMGGKNDSSGNQQGGMQGGRPSFDKSQFADMMDRSNSLTLEEYQKYAKLDSVKDFFYTLTVSINGSDAFSPVSSSSEDQNEETNNSSSSNSDRGPMGGFGGFMGDVGFKMNQSDFQIVGYSGENAMTSFLPGGTSSVTDGTVFVEGTTNLDCIISEELATYNSLVVGDTVVVTNPQSEEEEYTLTVVGIYTNTSANDNSFSSMMGMTLNDPANQIYMSYNALKSMVDASEPSTEEDEDSTALKGTLDATYVFANVENYEVFSEQIYELGLDESYKVNSTDIAQYESSLTPLNTLSTMAGWFLTVILIIGAVILIVLNIFNVRERKYEIGVLTAMGMKKGKVAMQFLTEIFVVTMAAVIIGIGIGGVSSIPVTNALLENQITAQESKEDQFNQNFGRPQGMGQEMGNMQPPQNFGGGFGGKFEQFADGAVDYITEINSAMNFTVVLQMLGIAILLTLTGGIVSILFIMRYEPLKILANRD